jgi:hypothetical protein
MGAGWYVGSLVVVPRRTLGFEAGAWWYFEALAVRGGRHVVVRWYMVVSLCGDAVMSMGRIMVVDGSASGMGPWRPLQCAP